MLASWECVWLSWQNLVEKVNTNETEKTSLRMLDNKLMTPN